MKPDLDGLGLLPAQTVPQPTERPSFWMLIVPAGITSGRDGRGPYDAGDAAAMGRIIANTRQRAGATEIMVDYDHQAMFAAVPGVGGNARAAGWVTDFRVTARGIEARVEWTDAARPRSAPASTATCRPSSTATTATGSSRFTRSGW